jgi:GT2 family glycosyltransferase/glycosyltransferase involved in cell wall biosynthesis
MTIIFDQYSRYKACSDLLLQTGFVAGNSVLDIGSGPECLFGQFLPDATMNYIDPLIPIGSGQGHITGDVFASELDGQIFDCVSAVDVLEHVPPEHRQAFLQRMSSLSKNTLILGFPTSDSSDAIATDKTITEQYHANFGHDYFWLEEHYRFGLPSLAETVEYLNSLGWRCQAVGHGHAPWLRELLGFVLCVWDIPRLSNIVLAISEKFNRELYPYDFRPPYYRQFVIATRSPLPPIIAPIGTSNSVEAESAFRALMNDAYQNYFAASMRQLAGPNSIFAERDTAVAERDTAVAERDAAVAERDAAMAERDAVSTELYTIKQSKIWRLAHLIDAIRRIIKNRGLSDYDQARIKEVLRNIYHKMPAPIRKTLRYGYTKSANDPSKVIQERVLSSTQLQHPAVRPSRQIDGRPDYIIWGVIDWHFRQQRPQHLAQELAASGRRVFYVSVLLIDDKRPGFEIEPLDAEGRLFQIKLYANGAPMIYFSAPGIEVVRQLRARIGEMLQWADTRRLVSFVQHPFWYDIASTLPNSRMVYDCMDHHEGFGNVAPEILALECALLRDAYLTITTSEYLDQIVAEQTKHRILIRNAGEFEHFSRRPASVHRDPQGRQVIGYYGAIAKWFDQDLVEKIARRFPDCCVLLIGADTVNAKLMLGRLPNVAFVGEVPYAELPHYLYGFDVCMLPFKIIPLTLATNPVKIYEYLSAGKTVVAVDLPEMKQFGDLLKVAGNADDFLLAIDTALCRPADHAAISKRQSFAKEQTWTHRVAALISHVEPAENEPKVSVIVVTYNNLDLTKACLASLDEFSDYTPLEIIVVDNASSDGSKKFLTEWAAAPNRKLISNGDNKGFAAANNQGLAIASGEYLVLLNNDTYVTPGWVRTLVNHLRRDSSIGLIGPVTNNIGNEAKINLSYKSMGEMLKTSASYTRRHISQTLQLRTAAFFCVMMRRDVYERLGPLDEAFGRGFFEDDDYCRRVERQGLSIVCAEDVFIHHHLSASFNKMKSHERQVLFEQNKAIYEAKWGAWIPHTFRKDLNPVPTVFNGFKHIFGRCNVCGNDARFFYKDIALWRESLNCEHCLTTSRYRSITCGILRAVNELSGIEAQSLAALPRMEAQKKLHIYDTQPPFYYQPCAYPLPDLLKASEWINVELSQFKPNRPMGEKLADGVTNQNLECLTFPDLSLDVVITSDVMEHVRLDDQAHREIHRVLRTGGIYIFTVPHNRAMDETMIRVQVTDPDDPTKDIHLLEPEYHGDTNADNGGSVLSYRVYGRDLEEKLMELGFDVEYSRENISGNGVMNAELYYCRKIK